MDTTMRGTSGKNYPTHITHYTDDKSIRYQVRPMWSTCGTYKTVKVIRWDSLDNDGNYMHVETLADFGIQSPDSWMRAEFYVGSCLNVLNMRY